MPLDFSRMRELLDELQVETTEAETVEAEFVKENNQRLAKIQEMIDALKSAVADG